LESEDVGQLIISTAWKPDIVSASSSQTCVDKNEGYFSDIVEEYNQLTRSKSAIGALVIDTISLFHNYCESSKNAFNNNWLGSISKGPESYCVHIK